MRKDVKVFIVCGYGDIGDWVREVLEGEEEGLGL